MKRLLIFTPILFALYGCPAYDPPHGYIEFFNNSDQPIYVYHNIGDTLNLSPNFQLFHVSFENCYDAWGNEMPKPNMAAPEERIDAYSFGKIHCTGGTERSPNLGHPISPDNKLYLFFIKEETMRNCTWEEIWQGQMYEKRDTITEKEMNHTRWRYTYHPPLLD